MKLNKVIIFAVALVSMTANTAFGDGSTLHSTARTILPGGIRPTPTSGYVDPISCAILGGAVTGRLCDGQRECWRNRCELEENIREEDCKLHWDHLRNDNGALFESCEECLEASYGEVVLCNVQTNVRWSQCTDRAAVGASWLH